MLLDLPQKSAVALIIALTATTMHARGSRIWSYQELKEKSDLVAIAQPESTTEKSKPLYIDDFPPPSKVIELSTKLKISTVLKGDESTKTITLRHYKLQKPYPGNPPGLIHFEPNNKIRYILFLKKSPDGLYEPTDGQSDPAWNSITPLTGNAR